MNFATLYHYLEMGAKNALFSLNNNLVPIKSSLFYQDNWKNNQERELWNDGIFFTCTMTFIILLLVLAVIICHWAAPSSQYIPITGAYVKKPSLTIQDMDFGTDPI